MDFSLNNIKQTPLQGLEGSGGGLASRLSGSAAESKYVDDVFSIDSYSPSALTTQITSGIDFSGEGGMMWKKSMTSSTSNFVYDTVRGNTFSFYTDLTSPEGTSTTDLLSFNSDGVTWDTGGHTGTYVNWSFRKCPGFFDVQAITTANTGSTQTFSHNLGSVPGMILIKGRSNNSHWVVYHKSLGYQYRLLMSSTSAASGPAPADYFGAAPTSTHFSLGLDFSYAADFMVYLFADDDLTFGENGDQSIIKCGSYTGTGSSNNFVNVGFEPQWIMVKRTDSSDNFEIYDNIRGMSIQNNVNVLQPSSSSSQISDNPVQPKPTGFNLINTGGSNNANGSTYIYVAIRRSNKPPTNISQVFQSNNAQTSTITTPFVNDWVFARWTNLPTDGYLYDRVRGIEPIGTTSNVSYSLSPNTTGAQASHTTGISEMSQLGYTVDNAYNGSVTTFYNISRRPKFFDVVSYEGDGSSNGSYTVNHNLQASPEMIITKRYDGSDNWTTYHTGLTSDSWQIYLNQANAQANVGNVYWAPTATTFKPQYAGNSDNSANQNGGKYIAYLFSSLDGVSKIGSYTGTGNNLAIDCGFPNGAQFVMIKRIDASGDWVYFDINRGMTSGNNPYMLFNSNNAQNTDTNYEVFRDAGNNGFEVQSGSTALNTLNGSYIYWALAV
tara:strand:- start:872 stop:2863 length:1992 start_codon:yes stop_codon:yes gene_type:complete